MFGIVASQRLRLPRLEARLILAVGIALPLIAVRLLYSIIAEFGNNSDFSPVGGSIGVSVGMSIVEEFLVVIVYVAVGYTLQSVNEQERVERLSSDKIISGPRAGWNRETA